MTPENNDKTQAREVVYLQPQMPPDYEEDEIDLLELWSVIWSRKWFTIGFAGLSTLAAILVAFFVLPVTYKSTAVLTPVQSSHSMGGLSALAASLPISLPGIGGGDTDNLRISDFLSSRTLKERLIKRYDLLPIIYYKIWDKSQKKWEVSETDEQPTVVKALQKKRLDDIYHVDVDKKTSLVTISWEGQEPAFCAAMLDRVIEELRHFLEKEYVTDAHRERVFVEKQLAENTASLEYWEKQVPSSKLTLAKITRERLAAQTVYAELRKQLELVKISEAKEMISFKVLDHPFIPEYKYKPKRALITAITGLTSLFFAIILVFIFRSAAERKEDNKHEAA